MINLFRNQREYNTLIKEGLVKIFENTDELNWLSCHDNQVK